MVGIRKYACLLAIALFALLSLPALGFGEKKITIGGKNFTEQYILPELAKQFPRDWRFTGGFTFKR